MANKGFDIDNPTWSEIEHSPFLRGKAQFDPHELVQTRRIASLRIHVRRAMEHIKIFHIFDRTLPVTVTVTGISGALRTGSWLLRLHCGKIWINFMPSEEA